MIRTIRESSDKYPWLIKGIMIIIATTFVIGMGWWGFEANQSNAVATVGNHKVTREELIQAKQRYYRFYKEQLKQEDVKEDTMRQLALEGLITNKAWQNLADELDLEVSAQELHDTIVKQQDFQKDGNFDPQLYQRLLANNRWTPHQYETLRKGELMAEKARLLVAEATTLTPAEMKEVTELASRQTKEGEAVDQDMLEQIRMQFLMQKKQRALQAFQVALRAQDNISINPGLM
ncbi:MAG: SurA N-terminal domain-containing protein [Nitrospirales bacterium]